MTSFDILNFTDKENIITTYLHNAYSYLRFINMGEVLLLEVGCALGEEGRVGISEFRGTMDYIHT